MQTIIYDTILRLLLMYVQECLYKVVKSTNSYSDVDIREKEREREENHCYCDVGVIGKSF